eukprot:CAMPEP_0119008434 /NCGR_PEP_ID=MMETSP1176-20130426/3687_1 /TAXON_ID=265551 /ORGANISM="Synedropsis recta cf, Strain CCMP1620" /LENGTH=625 /DNA_ID=CAMNT_0006960761 /DNA_START=54 /DNA_END=1927 /DNA_ORIENTATION=-
MSMMMRRLSLKILLLLSAFSRSDAFLQPHSSLLATSYRRIAYTSPTPLPSLLDDPLLLLKAATTDDDEFDLSEFDATASSPQTTTTKKSSKEEEEEKKSSDKKETMPVVVVVADTINAAEKAASAKIIANAKAATATTEAKEKEASTAAAEAKTKTKTTTTTTATKEEPVVVVAANNPPTNSTTAVANNSTTTPTTTAVTSSVTSTTAASSGIGGKDGFVYDVNKLKTNLVQRAVADYKHQLWELLGTPGASQNAIEEKLASLCQANPVYTTTDSNLLEGEWSTVFSSNKPAQVLLDDARFGVAGYESEVAGDVVGQTHPGGSRQFILENLEPSQDPFVVDKQKGSKLLLGLFGAVHNYYRVASLTRQSLDLVLFRKTWKLFGYPLWVRRYRTVMASQLQQTTLQVQILYLDSDLCISINLPTGSDGTVQENHAQPFTVYTKSPAWIARTEKMKRQFRKVRSRVKRIKGRISKDKTILEGEEAAAARQAVLNDSSMWLEYDKGDTKMKVVKLGDYGDDENEPAWEGENDPFVHLSPNDRQRIIKKMNIGEIGVIGKEKKKEVKRQTKKMGKKLNLKRQMKFEKPASEDIEEIEGVEKEKTDDLKRANKKEGKKLDLKRQMKFEKP